MGIINDLLDEAGDASVTRRSATQRPDDFGATRSRCWTTWSVESGGEHPGGMRTNGLNLEASSPPEIACSKHWRGVLRRLDILHDREQLLETPPRE
jgi:hypothetical protein